MPYTSPSDSRKESGGNAFISKRAQVTFPATLSEENVSCDQKEQLGRCDTVYYFEERKGIP